MRDFVVGTKPVSGLFFLENPPVEPDLSLNTCRDCANPLANTMKFWYGVRSTEELHTEEKSGLTSSPYIVNVLYLDIIDLHRR